MLKSTRLVLIFGTLLGLSVAFLPQASRATTFVQSIDRVSATIDGYLAFDAIAHQAGTPASGSSSYAYDSTNNRYTGTFEVGSHTGATGLGTTTYRVTCNYLADNDFTPNTCQYGWNVTATSTYYNATTHEAEMRGGNPANAYTIKSITANGLTGANSNWLMKVTGDSRTYMDGSTVHPVGAQYTDSNNSISRDYRDFEAVPYFNSSSKVVVNGNTFTPVSGTPTTYTYKGYQEFDVTYGFSAGHATADTYTGIITYTLAINASAV